MSLSNRMFLLTIRIGCKPGDPHEQHSGSPLETSVCATRRKITHERASAAVTGHASDDLDELTIFNAFGANTRCRVWRC